MAKAAWLLMAVLVVAVAHAARPMQRNAIEEQDTNDIAMLGAGKKGKSPYHTPHDLFIQERASKQLPGPGQHFSFGALVGWDRIHGMMDSMPDSKLLLLVRHGQAVSNFLSDSLGPDEWFKWETKCGYTDSNGTKWGIFDADLTDLGVAEADSLNSMLRDGGWFNTLTAGKPARAIVSPLTRCLRTASVVLEGLPLTATNVEENVRETLGEDTCDARRAASDPEHAEEAEAEEEEAGVGGSLEPVCRFKKGLRSRFPQYSFPITPPKARSSQGEDGEQEGYERSTRSGFGLLADEDPLWTEKRETQAHQVKRARSFLADLWAHAPERVVVVVTHSGFTRSVLLAVGREPYRPQNTEL
ncbi:hypothetical protein Agub_g12022, partial [Astrephomene gubernaculifera]